MLNLSNKNKIKPLFVWLLLALTLFIVIFSYVFYQKLGKKEVIEDDPKQDTEQLNQDATIIGTSVEGRPIKNYSFGSGNDDLLFVGGIHGGYEWNSVILAHEMIDFFENNPKIIPENLTINIIPVLNPDGVFNVVGKEGRFMISEVSTSTEILESSRFNSNQVDLNRNFACKWKPQSSWRGKIVNAGEFAFSEPEALALKKFVEKISPKAAIFWHSQANTVYASECYEGVLPETKKIMNLYADSAGYKKVESFDAYEVTGDAEGWLASIGIPAITVELETHETIEFDRNLAGLRSLLNYYKK